MACNYPSFEELNADLDALAIPDGWRLADTLTNGPGGDIECLPPIGSRDCPQVIRYYVATGSAEDVYRQAEAMLVDAGYVLEPLAADPCDLSPGLPECAASAADDDKRIRLQVFLRDHDFGGHEGVQIEDRSGPIVLISAWRVGSE
jgi:hypothetical protein